MKNITRKKMKILKLSTNKGGGATIAAERQARALRELGCDVKHLFIEQNWDEKYLKLIEDDQNVYIRPHMPTYIKTDLIFQRYIEDNRTNLSNTYMSLWKINTEFDEKIIDYIVKEDFDVIHFHWASNLISSKLMRVITDKGYPVVITGHDMNHFTGACHYDANCGKHKSLCTNCPHLINDSYNLIEASHREKINAINAAKPKYIFPSDWLNLEYRSSFIGKSLGKESSNVIRNCLDTNYFSPVNQQEKNNIRKRLGFDENEIIIVSGAENNHEIRKGFNYFESAVKTINSRKFGIKNNDKIKFVAFGGGNHILDCKNPDIEYRHLGTLKEDQVRDLFRSADLLAFTSIEENFANIILESLMCGCPVVGFNIGGIPDIVEEDINGKLVFECNESSYSSVLSNLILDNQLKKLQENTLEWHSKNSHLYSKEKVASDLLNFYTKLGHH